MSANSQRDEKGRFLSGNAYTKNLKRDDKGRFIKSSRLELIKSVCENKKVESDVKTWLEAYGATNTKKFDYSADKQLVDTLVHADDNSTHEAPKSYDLDDIRQAFYAGSNASRFYSIVKQWEIYQKNNNLT